MQNLVQVQCGDHSLRKKVCAFGGHLAAGLFVELFPAGGIQTEVSERILLNVGGGLLTVLTGCPPSRYSTEEACRGEQAHRSMLDVLAAMLRARARAAGLYTT